MRKNYVTIREFIETLQNIEEKYKDVEVLSIGSWSGLDRPCDYTLNINYRDENGCFVGINVGKKGEK